MLSSANWNTGGGGQRPTQLALNLARLGQEVVFVNSWRERKDPAPPPEGVVVVKMRDLMRRGLGKFDLVYIALPTSLFLHLVRAQKRKGAKIFYDVLDRWDVMPIREMYPNIRAWESRLMRMCDLVGAVSKPLKEWLEDRYSRSVVHIPNAAYEGFFWVRNQRKEKEVCYMGALGEYAPWVDMDALKTVIDAGIRLTLIGGYSNPFPNTGVIYHEVTDVRNVPSLIANCKVGLCPFKASLAAFYADPIKIWEYRAAGLRIVSKGISEANATEEDFLDKVRTELERTSLQLRGSASWLQRAGEFLRLVEQL